MDHNKQPGVQAATAEPIHFVASDTDSTRARLAALVKRYGQTPLDQARVVVAIGGDGFMLQTIHAVAPRGLPIYGMKQGSVGFLMNQYDLEQLPARLAQARRTVLHPLGMIATNVAGKVSEALAVNEVSLLRETNQAAKLQVTINGAVKLECLVCDGVLVATAAGSTAYNLSAHGPIIPLGADLLVVTPISPFRPRRWRGAILPGDAEIEFEILEHEKRPVSSTADSREVRNVKRVRLSQDRNTCYTLLFDPEHNLEERILNEQFER